MYKFLLHQHTCILYQLPFLGYSVSRCLRELLMNTCNTKNVAVHVYFRRIFDRFLSIVTCRQNHIFLHTCTMWTGLFGALLVSQFLHMVFLIFITFPDQVLITYILMEELKIKIKFRGLTSTWVLWSLGSYASYKYFSGGLNLFLNQTYGIEEVRCD